MLIESLTASTVLYGVLKISVVSLKVGYSVFQMIPVSYPVKIAAIGFLLL